MNNNNVTKLILHALTALAKADVDLHSLCTRPSTSVPRRREFVFAAKGKDRVSWPGRSPGHYRAIEYLDGTDFVAYHDILELTGRQPRKLLRALRRIEAATAWCHARMASRQRMAEEILRQQAAYDETLQAELAMQALTE